ncbi:MAG: S24 family peptidase [Planctomycetaceae bacterium]
MNDSRDPICRRLAELRERHYGPRGKARFARALGIRPSTYQHYEQDRTPPPHLLVEAARLTGADLHWLLTGGGSPAAAEIAKTPADAAHASPDEAALDLAAAQVLGRLRRLIAAHPDALPNVERFADLLSEVLGPGAGAAVSRDMPRIAPRAATVEKPRWSPEQLIPVLGSTAAGTARYWREMETNFGGPEADARLERVLAEHQASAVRAAEMTASTTESAVAPEVALVQLSNPDERGFVEFLSCPEARERFPHCVAWRIDGDSMAPRYCDGDLVLTSPDEPALDAHPCVARQRGQIGVNCKIYRVEGDEIVLVPVNERHAPQRIPADELQWAQRVLFSVRLSR